MSNDKNHDNTHFVVITKDSFKFVAIDLTDRRLKMGISKRDMAQSGINGMSVNKIEEGGLVNLDILLRYCELIGVDIYMGINDINEAQDKLKSKTKKKES